MAQSWLEVLQGAVSGHRLATSKGDLSTFASDALTSYGETADAVLLAGSEHDVIEAVRICHRFQRSVRRPRQRHQPVGGSLPEPDGVVIALNRLQRIDVDAPRRLATVGAGRLEPGRFQGGGRFGLYYAPDPSSQSVCSIGGNVAFNAGGAHCLKYGMTGNHVLGLRVVLPDGGAELGGESLESVGPGLTALFFGSEGLLGIALRTTLRLLPKPERIRTVLAAYASLGRPATPSPPSWPPACCRRRWRSWTGWPSRPPRPRSIPATRPMPAGLYRRARRRGSVVDAEWAAAASVLARRARVDRIARDAEDGPRSGRGARARSPPSAG